MPELDNDVRLRLLDTFPAISTAEWERAIFKDLKGASYEEKLTSRTEEGIELRPYYRRTDSARLGELADLSRRPDTQHSQPAVFTIRADSHFEAGANAVQQLAYTLSEGVDMLSAALDAGKLLDEAAREIELVFAVGPSFFLEIAKLRAARIMWSAVLTAFDPRQTDLAAMRIHAHTGLRNKNPLDPNLNLIRATTEALGAILGGCDSVIVEPVGFDSHLAENVERIIREEAHVDRVADVGGGSYYLETLTDALARSAWKLFQSIEKDGGWPVHLEAANK